MKRVTDGVDDKANATVTIPHTFHASQTPHTPHPVKGGDIRTKWQLALSSQEC
ncbi:MAG: hypothetical protein F6J92_08315 [Symploca sp. SIO1A3]|nr:hypothetical protein [Symploca sp. SIO1A3]